MKRAMLISTALLLALPTGHAFGQEICNWLAVDETVNKVKDAIANARANCPNPGGDPVEFDYVKTYDGSNETVTRKCAVTTEDRTFSFSDQTEITTTYTYLITQGAEERPELRLCTRKDEATGFFHAAFQILAGSLTDPIATCVAIIDESETAEFVNSVIECSSSFDGTVYRKDAGGRSCS